MKHSVIKWLLLAGTVYFAAVALFHLVGLKLPMFYIYFNVPSYSYQDQIISMFAFGWAAIFFLAAQEPEKFRLLVRTIIVMGAVVITILLWINFNTDFEALNPDVNNNIFSLELLPLFIYWVLLLVFTIRHEKKSFTVED